MKQLTCSLAVLALASFVMLGGCMGIYPPGSGSNSTGTGEEEAPESEKEDPADTTSTGATSTGATGTQDGSGATSTPDSTKMPDSTGSQGSGAEDTETEDLPADPQEIQLLISVDWEGGSIRDKNLEAMEKMRQDYPDVVLTHFLNAVYYTREGADKATVTQQIKRVVRDGDELGVHIHGWQSLFEAAGVTYRDGPNYLDLNTDPLNDWGYTVDIGAYTIDELRKVIAFSADLLESEGFGRAESFRSGGWMGRSNVLIALIREGFKRDASAVATVHFDDEFFTETNFYRWLVQLWPNMRMSSQPFIKTVQDDREQLTILEIPDNGALADYVKPKEMLRVYRACLAYKRTHPQEHVTMNFGFHDINAFRYLERVTEGIDLIRAEAKKDNINIVPVTTKSMKYTTVYAR